MKESYLMHVEHRIPHALRLAIFFLRVALGLNFFYFGWSALFNPTLEKQLSERSFGWLNQWLGSPTPFASIPSNVFAWIFVVTGVMIALGLFTRLAALVAAIVVGASLLTAINLTSFSLTQLVNDAVVAFFALFVLIFGKAGTYLGLDKFIHFSRKN